MSIHPSLSIHKTIKDPIFGLMGFTEIEIAWIDTPEFQQLRDCKQLGVVYKVYPSAEYSRFPHSLAVCFMVGELLKHIEINSKIKLEQKLVQVIRLAALFHDIAHTQQSHASCRLFQHFPDLKPEMRDHEQRACILIRSMWKKYQKLFNKIYEMNDQDIELIGRLILGKPNAILDPDSLLWIFHTIANHTNEFDCEKLVYEQHDPFYCGKTWQLEWQRIISTAKIDDSGKQIVYSERVAQSILEVFERRHKLYAEVYYHRAVLLIEEQMIQEVMIPLFKLNDWIQLMNDYESNDNAWRFILTDQMLNNIAMRKHQPHLFKPLNEEQQKLLDSCYDSYEKIQQRELYKYLTDDDLKIEDSKPTSPIAERSLKFAYANCKQNPLDSILCYTKHDPCKLIPLSQCNISRIHLGRPQEIKKFRFMKR